MSYLKQQTQLNTTQICSFFALFLFYISLSTFVQKHAFIYNFRL